MWKGSTYNNDDCQLQPLLLHEAHRLKLILEKKKVAHSNLALTGIQIVLLCEPGLVFVKGVNNVVIRLFNAIHCEKSNCEKSNYEDN